MAYRIEVSDTADAEADAAYFWLLGRSPEVAGRWYEGLLRAYRSLADFPGRCPLAPEASRFPDVEVRQLLYGRGSSAYRILYCILEPDTVRILHVRPGAQRHLGDDGDSDPEKGGES